MLIVPLLQSGLILGDMKHCVSCNLLQICSNCGPMFSFPLASLRLYVDEQQADLLDLTPCTQTGNNHTTRQELKCSREDRSADYATTTPKVGTLICNLSVKCSAKLNIARLSETLSTTASDSKFTLSYPLNLCFNL